MRGVYPGSSHQLGNFVVLPPPEIDDLARVLAGTAERIRRWLRRCGGGDAEPLAEDAPRMAALGEVPI